MDTKLLYQTDSYLKQFSARVLARQDGALILDKTAFYPGGGGQPADGGRRFHALARAGIGAAQN